MINVRKSGAVYSSIVGIGEQLKSLSAELGIEILMLNRGINMVENIDIQPLINEIDFNSSEMQVYPPVKGRIALRELINKEFFHGATSAENIFITNGGVGALDLIFKTLETKQVSLPSYYWGPYVNALKINKLKYGFYSNLDYLRANARSIKGTAVIICDPNNPTGLKYNDEDLIKTIEHLNEEGVDVIFDSPYRRLFFDWEKDDLYKKLLKFENLIVSESFSKSVGLSGQRIGFVHSVNQEFMEELAINILYATNGINNFGQILIEKILSTSKGKKAAINFRNITVDNISKNIDYLHNRKFLATEIYGDQKPWGIFVILNKDYDFLLANKIGSVPLSFFTQSNVLNTDKYTRICVSVPHKKFVEFFDKMK